MEPQPKYKEGQAVVLMFTETPAIVRRVRLEKTVIGGRSVVLGWVYDLNHITGQPFTDNIRESRLQTYDDYRKSHLTFGD